MGEPFIFSSQASVPMEGCVAATDRASRWGQLSITPVGGTQVSARTFAAGMLRRGVQQQTEIIREHEGF